MSWLDDLLLRLEMTVDPGSTPDLPPRPVTERVVTGISPAMDRAANLLDTGDKTLLTKLLSAGKVGIDWDAPDTEQGSFHPRTGLKVQPAIGHGFLDGMTDGTIGFYPQDIGDIGHVLAHELQHARQGPSRQTDSYVTDPVEVEARARANSETARWQRTGKLAEDDRSHQWYLQRFLQELKTP